MAIKLALGVFIGVTCLLTALPSAAGDDSVSALIKRQTQGFSDASLHRDQAAMNSYLDDEILFSDGSGAISGNALRDSGDAISTKLKRQTRAFINAGQHGDTAAMAQFFDDAAVLTNADGDVRSGHDFRAPAAPAEGTSTIAVTDWVLHHSADLAVSSYVDNQIVHYGAQAVHYTFRSVDTWIKRSTQWKLLASQTIPIPQDPVAVILPTDTLDEYTGSYASASGLPATITRDGNALAVSANGAKSVVLDAEIRDVFFTPGAPGAR